jgi:hypothetical protein
MSFNNQILQNSSYFKNIFNFFMDENIAIKVIMKITWMQVFIMK